MLVQLFAIILAFRHSNSSAFNASCPFVPDSSQSIIINDHFSQFVPSGSDHPWLAENDEPYKTED